MFKKLKLLVPDAELVKNFFTLITGNVVAQLIPVAAAPFITRIFDPVQFGLLGLFMVITNSFSVIAGGRFELAIMLPEADKESKNIFSLAVFMSTVTGVLFLLIILLFHREINSKLNAPAFAPLLFLTPLVIFLISTYQSINYWLIRKKAFRKNAVNKIGQTFSSTAGSIAFGLLHIPYGLVLGYAFGWFAINIVGIYQLHSSGFNRKGISFNGIKTEFYRYKHFLTYNTLPTLLNSVSSSLPLFFINLFFASAVAGYFTLSRQVLFVPLSMVSFAVSQVFFQRASRQIQQKLTFKKDFKILLYLLAGIGLIVLVVATLAGPLIFKFVFGEKWEMSGIYARILALSVSIQFVVSSFSVLLLALNKVKTISAWQVSYFIVICLLYFIGRDNIRVFLYSYLCIDVIMYSVYFVLILFAINSYEKNIKNENSKVI